MRCWSPAARWRRREAAQGRGTACCDNRCTFGHASPPSASSDRTRCTETEATRTDQAQTAEKVSRRERGEDRRRALLALQGSIAALTLVGMLERGLAAEIFLSEAASNHRLVRCRERAQESARSSVSDSPLSQPFPTAIAGHADSPLQRTRTTSEGDNRSGRCLFWAGDHPSLPLRRFARALAFVVV